jgi:hypothetical protein
VLAKKNTRLHIGLGAVSFSLSFSCSLVLSVFWHWHFSLGELLREGHSVLLAVPAARKREKH